MKIIFSIIFIKTKHNYKISNIRSMIDIDKSIYLVAGFGLFSITDDINAVFATNMKRFIT